MIRPVPARLAARAATGLSVTLLATLLGAPSTATEEPPGDPDDGVSRQEDGAEATPLEVSIDTMSPSSLPRRGELTVTGTITNRSDSEWTDLNVYLFVSESPMTTAGELAAATETDATLDVGARLTDVGLYDEVADLAPGDSTTYRLEIPRSAIPAQEEGVYWTGVHVLGSDESGRVDGADGRARTFLPLVGGGEARTTLSLVVPLKGRVRRSPDGTLANGGAWRRTLEEGGRLDRLLDLGTAAGEAPVTWLVDPAALDAVASLVDGDPPFDISPTDDEGEGPDPSPVPEGDEAAEGSQEEPERSGTVSEEARLLASQWLATLSDLDETQDLVHVPYGDPDTAAVLRHDAEDLHERAGELAAARLEELGLSSTPVLAPTDGRIPSAALQHLAPETPLLLDPDALRGSDDVVRLAAGHRVVRTSSAALLGGPSPTPPFAALALRQRILAEGAVHALEGPEGQPLVVTTPPRWDPGEDWASADFFGGLRVPWLRLAGLPTALAGAAAPTYDGPLRYTRADRRRELPARNVRVSQDLTEVGSVLASLLNRNDTIDEQVARSAMLAASGNARRAPRRAASDARLVAGRVRAQLNKVYVESSQLVTMSSETGNFSVTVVNELEEPVTVGLEVETGTDDLDVRSPDLVSLGPGQRASVRLAVSAAGTGVHSVSIVPTTRGGQPLGRETTIRVRSSQVGLVIWMIMGTGAAVFVVAIGLRIRNRVRARKRTHGPLLKDTPA